MSNTINDNNERLRQLRQELEQWNRTAGRRWIFSAVTVVAMVLFTGCYLYWVQSKVAEVTSGDVVALAEQQIGPVLHMPEEQLARHFKEAAPTVIAQLEQGVRRLPELAEMQAQAEIQRRIDQSLPLLEQELKVAFVNALHTAQLRVAENGGSVTDPQQAKSLLAQISAHLGWEMRAVIEKFYGEYTLKSDDLIAYLHRLSQDRNLDERERLHRRMLVSFFRLMQKYQLQGAPPLLPEVPVVVDAAPTE